MSPRPSSDADEIPLIPEGTETIVTGNLPLRGSPRRLRRYAIVPVCCGALAMSMAAAAPPGIHPDATLTPVATIAVGQDPISMAADQATGMVYVACTGPTADIYAIDSATTVSMLLK